MTELITNSKRASFGNDANKTQNNVTYNKLCKVKRNTMQKYL